LTGLFDIPSTLLRKIKVSGMKVAIVHDWLTGMRGGEKCLELVCGLLPEAHIFTLFHHRGKLSPVIESRRIHTSVLQGFPFAKKRYRHYLPLFPWALERFDLSGFDAVISLSHCVAKGAVKRPDAKHLCYCFTPMRYVWDMFDTYFNEERCGRMKFGIIKAIAARLRAWDRRTASRVDKYIAISNHVADRIRRHYGRDAEVIYPPVDCSRFSIGAKIADYYLIVSALAPYKRVDLAVETFNKIGRPLKIIGTGQDEARLRNMASSNVEFLGWVSDEELPRYYAECRAFVFPGEEDFGITPLEAAASGRPAIAYGKGGALETVIPPGAPAGKSPTGIFFENQSAESLAGAVDYFEKNEEMFHPSKLREHASGFDTKVYKEKMRKAIMDFFFG